MCMVLCFEVEDVGGRRWKMPERWRPGDLLLNKVLLEAQVGASSLNGH